MNDERKLNSKDSTQLKKYRGKELVKDMKILDEN